MMRWVGGGAGVDEREKKEPEEKKDGDEESSGGIKGVERILRCNCTMYSP